MEKDLNKDNYLWQSFIKGSENSFYELYDKYADILFRFGMHFSKDKEFIKDCIHDLFLDLYKYRTKLSMTDNIQYYLLRSLRRKIYHKKVKIIPLEFNDNINVSSDDIILPFEETIIASEIVEEKTQLLSKAMGKLTDRQREGLSLKFEHNLSYSEIAEILEMSVESARTAIYRALKTLRKSIQHDKSSILLLFFLSNFSAIKSWITFFAK